jgi:phage terminase large subunit-like protein
VNGRAAVAALRELGPEKQKKLLSTLTEAERSAFEGNWPTWAHGGQMPPNENWRTWVLLAGRGFGKTKAGAEWVAEFARVHPGAAIALVAATAEEARSVMIEGRYTCTWQRTPMAWRAHIVPLETFRAVPPC